MNDSYSFSVIIPHRNSVNTLKRLFDTIPERSDIEIILVDNSDVPITKEDVNINRDYQLCWADPKRFAGGARNEGMKHAHGRWLVFSDADDIFAEGAFDAFDSKKDSDSDVVYFGMDGAYVETGEKNNYGDIYTNLVKQYLADPSNDVNIRISFHSPCSKMVKRDYVEANGFQYDEVMANNDDYFGMLVGFNARKIEAVNQVVYTYIATKGSLMHKRSYEAIRARYEVILRKNQYLKKHGLGNKQGSIMLLFSQLAKMGVRPFVESTALLIKYHQNPFVGCSNWFRTLLNLRIVEDKNKKYITK